MRRNRPVPVPELIALGIGLYMVLSQLFKVVPNQGVFLGGVFIAILAFIVLMESKR